MAARRTSKIDPYADKLGKVLDSAIAADAGVTTEAVRQYRLKRRIPSLYENQQAAAAAKAKKPGKPSPIDAFASKLGKVPDKDIADQAGVTVAAVAAYRRYRSIPVFVPKAPKKAPAPKAKPNPVMTAPVKIDTQVLAIPEPVAAVKVPPKYAFDIDVAAYHGADGVDRYIVIATDMAAAVALVEAKFPGRVTQASRANQNPVLE